MSQKVLYRSARNPKEILNILERSVDSPGVFLWQQDEQGKRTSYDVVIKSFDPITQKLAVHFLSQPSLVKNQPVFIKSPIKDCAFKTNCIALNGNQAIIDFPNEMVVIESRHQARVYFKDEDHKYSTLHNPKSPDPILSVKGQILKVINVSPSGIAIACTAAQSVKFNVQEKLFLNSLNDHKFSQPIEIEVCHKVPVERKNQLGGKDVVIRIGFKLTQAIPQEIYEAFSFVDSKPKFDDQRFFKDQLFRDVVNANMQKVVKSFQEKPKLKNIFEALEVKREENRYLKNHIELLCEVTCKVGKDIGWISEKNLEKMVYISYLHDVRYFAKPSLAKIRDKKEFELRKAILSEEERKLFMEGPEYSAALAKDDDSSFPDAHKILLQHRERPNGRGFPHGEKASALAPLSCLFMVCHEFVDYLIADEEWSYEEFVSRNRHSYVGPYFNKIFQVFEDLK